MANKYWQILHYYTNYKYSPANRPPQYAFIVFVKKLVWSDLVLATLCSICDNSSVLGGVMVDVIAGLLPTPVLSPSVLVPDPPPPSPPPPPPPPPQPPPPPAHSDYNPLQRLEASYQGLKSIPRQRSNFGIRPTFFTWTGRGAARYDGWGLRWGWGVRTVISDIIQPGQCWPSQPPGTRQMALTGPLRNWAESNSPDQLPLMKPVRTASHNALVDWAHSPAVCLLILRVPTLSWLTVGCCWWCWQPGQAQAGQGVVIKYCHTHSSV